MELFWAKSVKNWPQKMRKTVIFSPVTARSINFTRFTLLDPGSLLLWNKSYWIHEGPSKSVQVSSPVTTGSAYLNTRRGATRHALFSARENARRAAFLRNITRGACLAKRFISKSTHRRSSGCYTGSGRGRLIGSWLMVRVFFRWI